MAQPAQAAQKTKDDLPIVNGKVTLTEEQWKLRLTPEQFATTRKEGTERAFTGAYWDNKETGMYICICCKAELFSSSAKFDSGTGWPSFFQAVKNDSVAVKKDKDGSREAIDCTRCGAHLGHVFKDGPKPTGLRYCTNSIALNFVPGSK